MKKILYINHGISKACGVYDLGLRHYLSIKEINKYRIIYLEIDNLTNFLNVCEDIKPDAIIFNYMWITSQWINKEINKYKCPKFCVPHLFNKNNIESFKNNDIFDYYIVLDNNSPESNSVFKTNRPLSFYSNNNKDKNKIPTIGSFGFAFKHKFFDLITKHVNECFDNAIINFHMPRAYFSPVDETSDVINSCYRQITKSGIKINITTELLAENEVINKLNKNDINCLFYDSGSDSGISSSLDYLISAQRPILISESNMFRSFSPQLPTYPTVTLNELYNNFDNYQNNVDRIYKESINNIKEQTIAILDRII